MPLKSDARVYLAQPDLGSLLCSLVLYEHVPAMFRLELPDESRIPELTSDAQVFAATHHGIGLAALRSRRYAILVEVVLLAPRDRYQSTSMSALD